MNIGSIYGNQGRIGYDKLNYGYADCGGKGLKSGKRDSVEISSAAYEQLDKTGQMTATSGKDNLEITKGKKENSFIIHFSDSAIVSRAVSRGYVTVNGVELKLSEKDKKQMLKVDEEASKEREKAYNSYVLEHELAVAKQQGETLKKAFEEIPEMLEMMLEMLFGKSEQLGKNDEQFDYAETYENSSSGVSWSQFEWKYYDTQMTVSFEETAKIENIFKGEIILNEKK